MVRSRRSRGDNDPGAAAIEFALVLPLLFVLLFGIIEVGFGLFQLQAAQGAVREAARGVALGVDACTEVDGLVERAVQNNGLGVPTYESTLTITSPQEGPDDADGPRRGDSAVLTLTYEPTIDFPLIPFPSEITRRSGVSLEDVGDNMEATCTVPVVTP